MVSATHGVPFLLLLLTKGCIPNCIFPEFMQSAKIDNVLQPWKTKTWWINVRSSQPQWKQREEIFVEGSNIWYQQEKDDFTCEKKTRRVSLEAPSVGKCVTRTLLYNRTCVAQVAYNKYRVVEFQPGHRRSPVFLCMMFVKRSSTVIQTWEGTKWERHSRNLCNEQQMTLIKWPWIATWKPRASVCPISGGFTFRTISRLTNLDICEKDWRKSKLEIECLKGDGMEFISPHGSSCNPFLLDGEYKRLYCWAGWEHRQYIYMVAGGEGEIPQYCVRFPKRMEGEFTVLIYFSVICPDEPHGQPPTGFNYYELHMEKIDPDVCEDENPELCRKAAKHGKCEKFHKHHDKIGPHCRKTCNLCDYPEKTFNLKCPFDEVVHGNWVLYDNYGRIENIKINRTAMKFSEFGTFVCKERTQDDRKYKVVSTFRNGCAAKYSCIDLHRRNNNILQYRIGRSYRHDEEFGEICQFRDGLYPIFETYRSSAMKNLIWVGRLWESPCGIYSSIPFNGTFGNEVCLGTVSDWNEQICNYEGYLRLQSDNCKVLFASRQYQCLLFIADETSLFDKFLITKSMDGRNNFNCWILTSHPTLSKFQPYREVIQMPTPQCSAASRLNIHMHTERRPTASLHLYEERFSNCISEELEAQYDQEVSQNISEKSLTTTEEISREVYSIKTDQEVDPSFISVPRIHEQFNVASAVSINCLVISLYTMIYLRYA